VSVVQVFAFGVTTKNSFGLIDTGRILSGVFHLAITEKLRRFYGNVRATGTRKGRVTFRV
jgi:hypothetical protein